MPQPEKTDAWKEAYERGIAGDLCDRILATRDIPDKLIKVLAHGGSPLMGKTPGADRKITNHKLTRRQQEVVHLMAAGWNCRSVADALEISYESANSILDRARMIMGAKNTTHLIALAIRTCEIV